MGTDDAGVAAGALLAVGDGAGGDDGAAGDGVPTTADGGVGVAAGPVGDNADVHAPAMRATATSRAAAATILGRVIGRAQRRVGNLRRCTPP